MELKARYKQTKVGIIPEDWDVRLLGEMAVVTAGGTPSRANAKYWNGSIPWVTTSEVDFCTIHRTEQFITKEGLSNSAAKLQPPGTLLMALYGQGKTRGKISILGIEAATNQACAAISLKRGVSRKFIFYFLAGQYDAIRNLSNTGNQENLNGAILRSVPVLLPKYAEQQAIATALDDVDALLAALERLIAKKRDLKQATMQQLLTGKTRLPGFAGEWEVKTLLDLAERKKELFDDGDWVEAEFLTDRGIRLVQTGNIGEGHFADKESQKYISAASFEKLRCKDLRVGDLLICRLAEPAGRTCILPDIGEQRVITAVDVTIFRPPTSLADRRFLVNAFNTRAWFQSVSERCGGTTRARIARGQLGKMEINLPPVPEQIAIAAVLTDMDAELAALEQRLAKTGALKQGMMQELLTGRTRLVSPQEAHA